MNLNSLLAELEGKTQIEKSAAEVQPAKPAISAELSAILEKKASEDLSGKAFAAGEELARQLLEKMANEIQESNDKMVASDNQKVVPIETNTSVEGAMDGSLAQGVANGAVIGDRVDDITDGKGPAEAAAISVSENRETPPTTDPQLTNKENEMSKTAQDNKALAQQIMEKLAQDLSPQVTDASADASVAAAPVPNKIQQDNATMSAQADAVTMGVGPVPGQGTVDDLFQAIVARAQAQGAGHPDIVAGQAAVPRDNLPNDSVEKAAAVSALCDEGLDFESAVELVKQAEEAINAESWEQEKVACVTALIQEGINFDDAIALVKQAEQDLIDQANAQA